MDDPNTPDPSLSEDLPADLPPEYADAYRRGYQRAWATSHGEPEPVEGEPTQAISRPTDGPIAEPVPMSSYDDLFADVEPAQWDGPTHRDPAASVERPAWLVPVLLGGLVMALILGAYGIGRLVSSSVDTDPRSGDERLRMPPEGATPRQNKPANGKAWQGDVRPLTDVGAASSCVLAPGTDAAGRKVAYSPDQAVDGDFTTAWRCAGDGQGVTLRLELGSRVRLGELGLVPGYAKTDPQSRADRYAENNRITRVRWTFPNGTSVVQQLDGSPSNRRIQTMRIPPVQADEVTLEVLASARGPRNTIAVSELQLAETIG